MKPFFCEKSLVFPAVENIMVSLLVYWTCKGFAKSYLSKETVISIILQYFLIRKCLFTSDSLVFSIFYICFKDISIFGGVDSTPFYANLFFYFFI